jgi:hypothetical protein
MPRYDRRYLDPDGHRYALPTFPWRFAPDGLATRRQLRALGLCPGGRPPVAQVMWRRRGRRGHRDGVAYLYDLSLARPKRTAGPAVRAALHKALAARRTCPSCGQLCGYVIPRRYGECLDCADRYAAGHGRRSLPGTPAPATPAADPAPGRLSA